MGVKTSSWTRSLRNRLALKPRPCGHPGREQHVLEGQRKEALSSPGGTSLGPAPSSGRQRHCRNFPLEKSRTCPSLRRQSPATVLPGSASCFDWRPSASQAAPRHSRPVTQHGPGHFRPAWDSSTGSVCSGAPTALAMTLSDLCGSLRSSLIN